MKRILLAAIALVAIASVVPAGASAAGRPTTTTTTMAPAPGQGEIAPGTIVNSWALAPASSGKPNTSGRPEFSYSAAAGTTIRDEVTLFNYSNVQLTFHLYATDAFNNAEGQFDLLPGSKRPTDIGRWVRLPQENLTLAPKTQATFPFTVEVPTGASPGDHSGAIVAANDAVGQTAPGRDVAVELRTGSRLFIRVAGRLVPEVAVQRLNTSYTPSLNPLSGRVDLTYRVQNTGNVRMDGQVAAKAAGLIGLGARRDRVRSFKDLLPGESLTVTTRLEGVPATLVDRAQVVATARPGAGGAERRSSASSSMLAPPVTPLALLAAVLLLARSRRSIRRHSRPSARVPALRTS